MAALPRVAALPHSPLPKAPFPWHFWIRISSESGFKRPWKRHISRWGIGSGNPDSKRRLERPIPLWQHMAALFPLRQAAPPPFWTERFGASFGLRLMFAAIIGINYLNQLLQSTAETYMVARGDDRRHYTLSTPMSTLPERHRATLGDAPRSRRLPYPPRRGPSPPAVQSLTLTPWSLNPNR